jgi:hypothetical protein
MRRFREEDVMFRVLSLAALGSLLACVAVAGPVRASDQAVPATVEGGAERIKQGGQEVGEGFRGVGRGIKDTFTGQRSKEDYEEGKKIGTGFANIGKGVGGVGRGVGHEVKEGFTKDGEPAQDEEE